MDIKLKKNDLHLLIYLIDGLGRLAILCFRLLRTQIV